MSEIFKIYSICGRYNYIYITSDNINDLYVIMNEDLKSLTDWFSANKLSLNVAKTNYMIFSNCKTTFDNYDLTLANRPLTKTSCTQFFGVYIDDQLKWNGHIQAVKPKSPELFSL
jgi:hypothetical protein